MSDQFRIDSHKLMYHPHRVAHWDKNEDQWEKAKTVFPIYVELSPFGACNHRCTFCAMDFLGYKAHRLDFETLQQRIPEMASLGVGSVMFGGEGEPLLHADINAMTDLANDVGLDTAFTTNGVKMEGRFVESTMARVSWIKISLNAGSAETYSRIHQTKPDDFHTVVDNLKNAVRQKQQQNWPVTIGVQILLLPENAHEIESLAALCRDEIGVDYLVVKPYSQHHASHSRTYENIDYAPYLNLAETLEQYSTDRFKVLYRAETIRRHSELKKSYDCCLSTPFFWAYIRANGDVYSCSAFLEDNRFLLGNIGETTFKEIWQGEGRRLNWKLMRNQFEIDQCRINCRMDTINAYLWELKNPSPHVNFI